MTDRGQDKVFSFNKAITKSNQPAFLAKFGSAKSNVTGDSTVWTAEFDAEEYDTGGNYNTTTYTYTAPYDGMHILNVHFILAGVTATNEQALVDIVTSNQTFQASNANPNYVFGQGYTVQTWMDAADTAYITLRVDDEASKNISLSTTATQYNRFGGYLI